MAQESDKKEATEEEKPTRKGVTEHEILNIIRNCREEGILQSEIWKMVNADSREGSRAILRLEKKGLINRKKELHQGRWTYRVVSKLQFSTVDSIIDIPCAFCDLESKCGRSAILSPTKCDHLTVWLNEKINQENGY